MIFLFISPLFPYDLSIHINVNPKLFKAVDVPCVYVLKYVKWKYSGSFWMVSQTMNSRERLSHVYVLAY